MRYLLLALLVPLFLSACGATPYQSGTGTYDGGYFHKRISEDIYEISFRANGFSNDATVYDYTLLRAAEIGYELGYEFFAVSDNQSIASTTETTFSTPAYQASGDVNWSTSQMNIRKPAYRLLVTFGHEKPSSGYLESDIFEIRPLIKSLKLKHGIE